MGGVKAVRSGMMQRPWRGMSTQKSLVTGAIMPRTVVLCPSDHAVLHRSIWRGRGRSWPTTSVGRKDAHVRI